MEQAIDFGNSLDWLGKGAESAAETPAQADDKAPLATEAGEEKTAETPVDVKAEDATETVLPVSTVVDDLGGEDAARQFIPLIRAIESVDAEPEKQGENIQGALLKILTPDQFGALTWAQYDKYGELMASQYLEDHPEFAEKLGLVKADAVQTPKATASDYDDDLIEPELEELSPREKALQAQLDATNARLNQIQSQIQNKDTQTEQAKQAEAQQAVKIAAEKAMFGTVVDENFSKLEGWTEEEQQRVLKIAFAGFNADQAGVDQYKKGLEYQKTQQALLAGWQVKARNTFANHLKDAIELVDSKRAKTATATAPVPPRRQEISTTTPTKEATQPEGQGNGKFFDSSDLMRRVNERLRSQGASPR